MSKLRKFIVFSFFLLIGISVSDISYAADIAIENNTGLQWIYHKPTNPNDLGQNAKCKSKCYQVLAPNGAEQWVTLGKAKTAWIQLTYDSCRKVTYDNQGKPTCSGYVANFTIVFNHKKTDFKLNDPKQNHFTFKGGFPVNHLSYNDQTPTFPKAKQFAALPFRGVNLAGAEFGASYFAGNMPRKVDGVYFATKGMNTFRVPIKWSYAQQVLMGPLTTSYVDTVHDKVNYWVDQGYNVILDLHAYMRHSPGNNAGGCRKTVSAAQLADIWSKLAKRFADVAAKHKQDQTKGQLLLELMNEPHDMSTQQILANQNAAIASIRAQGLTNLILISGNHWTGMESWFSNRIPPSNAKTFIPSNIKDPQDNYAISVHQYFDSKGGMGQDCVAPSKVLSSKQAAAFANWLHQYGLRAMLTETGGKNTANCIGDINTFLQYVYNNRQLSNAGGFIGWTGWAGGHAWGNYPMSLTPDSQGNEKPQMLKAFANYL